MLKGETIGRDLRSDDRGYINFLIFLKNGFYVVVLLPRAWYSVDWALWEQPGRMHVLCGGEVLRGIRGTGWVRFEIDVTRLFKGPCVASLSLQEGYRSAKIKIKCVCVRSLYVVRCGVVGCTSFYLGVP